jgi:predicted DNA-binding transcriptional regulator AlpA
MPVNCNQHRAKHSTPGASQKLNGHSTLDTPTEPFRLLTTKEAARVLGLSSAMLERLRWMRDGPPFVRPTGTGRAVRYRWRDLVDWIERNRVDPEEHGIR